ncbi:sugar phosphate isomerase/epimerase family protein [Luteibacter aegosomatissinici]|uniref:sugar phosphate isomerase/epimerase family protein n=1 Tax=Luteibacter aegosomatissinici TaxID=2911539 RepID=UPI001FFACF6A|nr:sugar phosphate isomerase/epimerase [Luteibacter aegosomatissinici]UPG94740.1 sugar phosphate isomerase/epimerase [Luteibacter aegosomatissinici]
MITRRQFLARSALCSTALGLGLAAPGKLLAAASKGKSMGIQLYMVLDAYQKDPVATLKTLKSIGYTEIEAIVTSTAETLRDQLKQAGLACPSMHFDSLGFEPGIKAAHTLGSHFIVSSMLPGIMQKEKGASGEPTYTLDDAKRTAEYANKLGQKAKAAGLQYAYHNHHAEFTDVGGGKTFYDVLLAETDHALVQFELDCGWVHAGGKNPTDYFKANPGRIPLMHAKDFLPGNAKDYPGAELGRGTLDYKPIMAAADAAGLKHCFVEQEGPFARMSSLEAARVDFDYLHPLR